MKNIKQVIGDNLGGLSVCFYTDQENVDISRFPKREGSKLVGNIVLKPGCSWGYCLFTRSASGYEASSKTDKRGTLYAHSIKGNLPKGTPELDEILLEMNSQRRYLVLHRDLNGYLRLSGGPDYGLQFQSEYRTDDRPDGQNGYEATFKGEALLPALYYSGSFQITDLGEGNPTTPGNGNSGFVTITDGNGNIKAVVPAGQTFQITSGFSYGFRILT